MSSAPGAAVKVLHVCTVPITAQTFIAPLARHLQAAGFDVSIACSLGPDLESGDVLRDLVRRGFRVAPVAIPRTIRPVSDLRAVARLYGLIRAEGYRIVHTQTSKAGVVGRLAARLAGVPVVIHTAHAFPFHPLLPPRTIQFYAAVERWMARLSDLIMVDTDAIRDEGLRHRVAPAEKITTVHMGIDLGRFSPQVSNGHGARREWGVGDHELVVGAVARLVADKGLDCLIEATSQIAPRWPALRLVIVGGGPLKPSLERLSRERGIGERVIFAGVRNDVPAQLAAMDLFVLPTRREGFGVAFAEAMAMSKPVIGSAIPPVREVVGDSGEAGILLPPDRPGGFAAAMETLLADASRRRAMGAAGRARIERLFNEREMCERVESEYRRLLNAKGLSVPS